MESILYLLNTFGPFCLLLGFLIFFHELGHFAVARYFGVRVEVFSIGFGKTLLKFKRGDTEYRLALFPLGGFVKMYGDNPTAEVPEAEKKYSFIHQPVWPRIAIVLAGPIANLILAFVIFFVIGLSGETQVASTLGDIKPDSVAYNSGLRSGDQVLKVNQQEVKSFEQLENEIAKYPNQDVTLTVLRDSVEMTATAPTSMQENPNILSTKSQIPQIEGLTMYSAASNISFDKNSLWAQAGLRPLDKVESINGIETPTLRDLQHVLGQLAEGEPMTIVASRISNHSETPQETQDPAPKVTEAPASKNAANKPVQVTVQATYNKELSRLDDTELYLGHIQPNSPAEKAGLRVGDKILQINDTPIEKWDSLLNLVKNYEESQGELKVTFLRNFEEQEIKVVPLMKSMMNAKAQEERRPIIGIVPGLFLQLPAQVSVPAGGLWASLRYSGAQTNKWTVWTINSIKKVIFGEVSHKNLGGLFTIGQVASQSFKVGWTYFLQMMGIISINLFLLNLIPIPVLDGGHLLFFSIEALRGKPVSPQKMEIAFLFGFVVLASLMGFTLFNDIQRIFFSGW